MRLKLSVATISLLFCGIPFNTCHEFISLALIVQPIISSVMLCLIYNQTKQYDCSDDVTMASQAVSFNYWNKSAVTGADQNVPQLTERMCGSL